MKPVYLINFTIGDGTLNLGDQIVRESINEILFRLFGNEENVVVLNFSSHQPLSCVHRRFINVLRRNSIKMVFTLSGGNAFHFGYTPFAFFNQWSISFLDVIYVRDVILFGAGTSTPLRVTHPKSDIMIIYSKYFWRKILNNEFIHAVRDEESKRLLISLGFNNVKNLGCPSLWKLNQEHIRYIPKQKADAVVMTLNSLYPSKKDVKLVELLSDIYRDVYFWPQGYTDIYYIKLINSRISKPIKIIPPNLDAYDNFMKIQDVDYVGVRVHAGIRALHHKKRSIIIAIDHRALSWNKSFGLPTISREKVELLQDIIINPIEVNIKIPEAEVKEYLIAFKRYVLGR